MSGIADQIYAQYHITGDPIAEASTFLTTAGVPGPTWDSSDTAGVGKKFSSGSIVQNTITNVVYRCADATTNNAVWFIMVQEEI